MGFSANKDSISDKALKALNVSRTFGRTKALNKVNFEAKWGIKLGIFGPNGAGKSTLLKVLAGISTPNDGKIEIAGMDLKESRARSNRITGYVGHQPMLFQNLTVIENLIFFAKMYGVPNIFTQIESLLDQFKIGDFSNQRVSTLSNGMQKRVTIARSLIHSPSILLLDEPETGLDKNGIEILDQVIDNIANSGSVVLMSTHDLTRGLELSNDVLVINNGDVVFNDSANTITDLRLRELLV